LLIFLLYDAEGALARRLGKQVYAVLAYATWATRRTLGGIRSELGNHS